MENKDILDLGDSGALFLFLLVLAGVNGENLEDHLDKIRREEERGEETRRMCAHIEWEQDMGAHIPFCKLYGGFCDLQCLQIRD